MQRTNINVMEEIVDTLVNELLSSEEYQMFCSCEKCKKDISALSLNNLPNQYVTTDKGRQRIYDQLNTEENRKWINKRIINAIHVVGKYPQHNNK